MSHRAALEDDLPARFGVVIDKIKDYAVFLTDAGKSALPTTPKRTWPPRHTMAHTRSVRGAKRRMAASSGPWSS
jgi:hypothetical protein